MSYIVEVLLANGTVVVVEDAFARDGMLRLDGPDGRIVLSDSAWLATRSVWVDDELERNVKDEGR